ESLGYTDYSIQKFFESASKEDWYQNTLFVITGDHTQKSDNPQYQDDLGHYRVPVILYHPSLSQKQWPAHDTNRPIQHADIMPTVLDTLDIPQDKLSKVGSSAFSNPHDAFVVNRTPEGYWYLSSHLIKMDLNHKIKDHADENEKLRMKAYMQYYVNGIIENKLFK
ncbi:MAG: sulfatase-like hydrolase/transferase, partial [Bdellovibrionales bacterium]|nr:sulfatase-like hydrolase/transferase [Bdellovibrionales bacterium]